MSPSDFDAVVAYHEQSKHHPDRYARSLGYMDWANQPIPFRYYEGARPIRLPFLKTDTGQRYADLYVRGNTPPRPFDIDTLGGLLELSLGLSAWKSAGGSRWSLRINPSSGNLHPTECHLLVPPLAGCPAGVYHYNPFLHALECRAELPEAVWDRAGRFFGRPVVLVALTSIFWRESWKYGERAFRYCQHDTGHAVAALSFSAALFGWQLQRLTGVSDDAIDILLGFDRVHWHGIEREEPELLCAVSAPAAEAMPPGLPENLMAACAEMAVQGRPNRLSNETVTWEVIYDTARRVRTPDAAETPIELPDRPWLDTPGVALSATAIIRQRRSAVDFDRRGAVAADDLMAMLDRTLPARHRPPFDAGIIAPSVHLLLFVHNVTGLAPGLYLWVRDDSDTAGLRRAVKTPFVWEQPLSDRPLFLLEAGDFRRTAMMVSCHQEIAGFSAVSLGMLARFAETLRRRPWGYRYLFWETGMIGQVLYLEAEARGVRGTGIGCFFDDAVHDLLGLADNTYQSLYHFTFGTPVDDPRIDTLPPYEHLRNA